MKRFGMLIVLTGVASLWSQSGQPSPQDPDKLIVRWRMQIMQDLQRRGLLSSRSRPTISKIDEVIDKLKPLLPEGTLRIDKVVDDAHKCMWRIHAESMVDETRDYKFIRVWQIQVEKWDDITAAAERMAEMLSTPAVYRHGPLMEGDSPGQLCYHYPDPAMPSEVFVRENVVVALHCSGPLDLRKTPYRSREDRRFVIPDRTSVPGRCTELTSELGLRIDRLIRDALDKRPDPRPKVK